MIYAKDRIKKAEVHWDDLAKLNDTCSAWGDRDENFNVGIGNFGVDFDAFKILAVLNCYFRWWIEDWEKPLLKKNYPVARENISDKYWGLVFHDIDDTDKVLYTI